jgi:iron complex outermembrane receptor protein
MIQKMHCAKFAAALGVAALTGFSQTQGTPSKEAGGSKEANKPEEVYTLEEFHVTENSGKENTKSDETLGALRINTRLVDSPVSVAVLPREFVENFKLEEVDDQLSFVAGGNLAGERQSGTGGYVSFRGFQPQFFRNGFQRIGIAEVVNLERVEFIKGPLAATFGLTEPGGIVNYVTQRPFRKSSTQFKTTIGSYDYQRYEAHTTGPLSKGKVFARVDLTYTDMDGFQNFFYNKTFAGSTAITFQPTNATTITAEVERLRRTMNRGQAGITEVRPSSWVSPVSGKSGQSVTGGVAVDLERIGFNPLGTDNTQIRNVTTVDLRGEHRFNSVLSLRANLQWWERPYEAWTWTTTSSTSSAANYSVATGNFNSRDPFHDEASASTMQGQIDLLASFKVAETDNKLLMTFDMSDFGTEGWSWKMPTADRNALPASVKTLSAANPDFSGFNHSLLTNGVEHNTTDRTLTGFLLSERMALGKSALLFASYRYDRMNVDYSDFINPDSSASKRDGQSSYSFGSNLRLLGDSLVLFGNHSTSFTPQLTRDKGTGALQDSVTAEGDEAGFKGELLNGKMFWTASVYRIDRDNIPQLNPLYSDDEDAELGVPQYVGAGKERSKGAELEIYADLAYGLSLTASGAYMDATTLESLTDPAKKGVPLLRTPRRTGSLSLTYSFKSGFLDKVKVGASMRYCDDYVARYGTAGSQVTGSELVTNKLRLNYGPTNRIEEIRPSATIYDAFISYKFDTGHFHHLVGLSAKNLMNHEWWSASGRKNDPRTYYARYELRY